MSRNARKKRAGAIRAADRQIRQEDGVENGKSINLSVEQDSPLHYADEADFGQEGVV